MSRKRFTVEQIIGHLREAEVRLAQGRKVGDVCREFGVSEQSYYRWRKEYVRRQNIWASWLGKLTEDL
ncbi:MAG: transposase, partial [Rhodospirillaceae bacterium]